MDTIKFKRLLLSALLLLLFWGALSWIPRQEPVSTPHPTHVSATSTLQKAVTTYVGVNNAIKSFTLIVPFITITIPLGTFSPALVPTETREVVTPINNIPIPSAPIKSNPTPSPPFAPSPTVLFKPKSQPIFGIQMDTLEDMRTLEKAKEMGGYWVQSGTISWSSIETIEGERNWSALENFELGMKNVVNNDLVPIVTIGNAPLWAQKVPGYSCGPILEDKFTAFSNLLYDLVVRYHNPPFNIKYWQIWNEPDAGLYLTPADSPWGCWGDQTDQFYGGSYYGEMLKVIYPRIKAADPEAIVVIGGLLSDCGPINPPETQLGSGIYKDCTNSKFFEGILEAGAGSSFDVVNYHSYDYYYGDLGKFANPNWNSRWDTTGVVLLAKTQYYRSLLYRYGYPEKMLINTETAVICGRTGEESQCQTEQFELTKAYYLVQTYASAISEGLEANFWYSYKGWRASGLVDKSLSPLPAYLAYSFCSFMLQDVSFSRKINDFTDVVGYEFVDRNRRVWILWSKDSKEQLVKFSSFPTAAYDVFGNRISTQRDYTITVSPIYIEWGR